MFLLILGFVGGVFVGYKYPQQVEQVLETIKKLFNDLKNMISKKETPPQS
jgi:Na+/H+-dicarboxylate symporter